MDCAPLNMAHFHERRADKLIRRHRYEEAFKAVETSLLYVENASKHVKIPMAMEVLKTQKWDYERKLNQIQMRKLQYEKMKSKEIVPSVQTEVSSNNIKTDIVNAQSIARSIDKTIKEFNDKYGSRLVENIQQIENKESRVPDSCNQQKSTRLNENGKDMLTERLETNIRRLSLVNNNLQTLEDDLPSLVPLELPSFDYAIFGVPSEVEEKFQS